MFISIQLSEMQKVGRDESLMYNLLAKQTVKQRKWLFVGSINQIKPFFETREIHSASLWGHSYLDKQNNKLIKTIDYFIKHYIPKRKY